MSKSKSIYKVRFVNQGNVYEVFARKVYASDLMGFVTIEELIFGERSAIVVDPSEEKLKNEFAAVKRSLIPMHAVIRIDEVEKEGPARISELGTNVTTFPANYLPAGTEPTKKGS